MTLGEKITALRNEQKISQGDLADQIGVSRQSVSKWETDASVPELDKLVLLSEIFHVTLDELVKKRKNHQSRQHRGTQRRERNPRATGSGNCTGVYQHAENNRFYLAWTRPVVLYPCLRFWERASDYRRLYGILRCSLSAAEEVRRTDHRMDYSDPSDDFDPLFHRGSYAVGIESWIL